MVANPWCILLSPTPQQELLLEAIFPIQQTGGRYCDGTNGVHVSLLHVLVGRGGPRGVLHRTDALCTGKPNLDLKTDNLHTILIALADITAKPDMWTYPSPRPCWA
jgi:hypothetical protein